VLVDPGACEAKLASELLSIDELRASDRSPVFGEELSDALRDRFDRLGR
jgi:hypothetical protein